MPDTTEPYGYIEMEIERLKYAERKATAEASRQSLISETHMLNRMELETALKMQKDADSGSNNDK